MSTNAATKRAIYGSRQYPTNDSRLLSSFPMFVSSRVDL